MSKLINKITAVIILAFITVMLVFTIVNGKFSFGTRADESEETYKKGIAAQLLSGYMTENLCRKSFWVKLNADINGELGEGLVNGVYINGDMLLDADINDKSISDGVWRQMNRFASNYDGAVYFAAIPTSSGVYGDKLPPYLEKNSEVRLINSLYEQLDSSIKKVDACNILKTHSNNYIYYRNDTKWTGYGAYCVYRTVIQKLGFTPAVYDKYTIRHLSSDFRGNLYKRTGWDKNEADIIDAYDYSGGARVTSCIGIDSSGNEFPSSLYDKELIESDYMYDMYLGRETPLLRIKTSVNNDRKLLVIKDSYADCFVPFLTQHYSEIAVVTPELIKGCLSDYIDTNDYAQTLFLFGIDSLADSDKFELLNK